MKALWLWFLLLSLASCTEEVKTPGDAASAPAAAETVVMPAHNYSDIENGLYLYPQELSDDQKKAGLAAAGFVALKYLGVRDDVHYLQDEHSSVISSCANPCTIIRQTLNGQVVNRVQYNPNTIIGAAFADAINGHLNLYTQFKDPAAGNTAERALLDQWSDLNEACRGGRGDDPLTQVACNNRETIGKEIAAHGYCYGEFATDGASSDWAKCSNNGLPEAQY